VVGARAVVSRDVPAYHIVAGNPARTVRSRFNDRQVAELLRIAWWEWPIDRIRAASSLLCSDDIEAFIDSCRNPDP
jgi:hypothetical protein